MDDEKVVVTEQAPPTEATPVTSAPDAPATAADDEGKQDKQASEDGKPLSQEEANRAIKNRLEREKRKHSRELEDRAREIEYWRNQVVKPKDEPQKAQATTQEPKREAYESYEEYVESRAEWRAREVIKQELENRDRQAAEQKSKGQIDALAVEFSKREDAARDRIEDYDDVIGAIRPGSLPRHVIEFVGESDLGPDILYMLGNDTALAGRIAKLTTIQALRELTKLELKAAEAEPKSVSKTPEPVKPLASRDASFSDTPSDKDSDAEWARKREAQLKARRQR